MPKVIFKTIVSEPRELPFVVMNLIEMSPLCDELIVTEANINHVGEIRESRFQKVFDLHIQGRFPKARFIFMDLAEERLPGMKDAETLHSNEQKIRNGFLKYMSKLSSRDIVISTDGDEVLRREKIRPLVWLLKFWPSKKGMSFTLSLDQFLYFVNLHWKNCGFYGPTISHADFFLKQESPQWRYGGKRLWKSYGSHFSWVMSTDEMVEKILSYAHRLENQQFADRKILENARKTHKYIFGPETNIEFIEVNNVNAFEYPRSISHVRNLIRDELVISPERFWGSH